MSKENKMHFDADWYELWTKQSREFYESAESNLKEIFGEAALGNPENHLKQIQKWLDSLKDQWQFNQLTNDQKIYQDYWKMMAKMCNEASDMMMKEWVKRSREDHPIKTIRELYELWLNCCHEVYKKSLTSNAFQETYGELMNASLKFWQEAMRGRRE